MDARHRPFVILVLVLGLILAPAIALAQTDGPDPDSPIQIPTRASNDDDLPKASPTEKEDETPTIGFDSTATRTVESSPDDPATPAASPVAAVEPDLAAMTLDSRAMPEEFVLIGEAYTQIDDLLDATLGLIDRDALLDTGILAFYQSEYVNVEDGNTIRSYVISYDSVDGVQAGFDLLENEEMLIPNGFLEDLPGLSGVGEKPAEITSGTIEVGDGTRTGMYDVTFRVDRFQAGVVMQTQDGSAPAADVIDGLAAELADRVAGVVAGNDVTQIVFGLPDQLIQLEVAASFEGYQTVEEAVVISDPRFPVPSYLGGYYRAGTFSESISSILPYVTIGVNQFDSALDAREAMLHPDSMLLDFDDLEEIRNVELPDAGIMRAYSFSSPQGSGSPDSFRVFMLVDDQVILIDVQGMESLDDAESAAMNLAQIQLDCTVNGVCDVPGGIGEGTGV